MTSARKKSNRKQKKQTNWWRPCDSKNPGGGRGDRDWLAGTWSDWQLIGAATLFPRQFPQKPHRLQVQGETSASFCAALWLTAVWSDRSFRWLLQQQTHNNCFAVFFTLLNLLLYFLLLQTVITFAFPSASLLPRLHPLCLFFSCNRRHSTPNVSQLFALERSTKQEGKFVCWCFLPPGKRANETERFWLITVLEIPEKKRRVCVERKAAWPTLICAERDEERGRRFSIKSPSVGVLRWEDLVWCLQAFQWAMLTS